MNSGILELVFRLMAVASIPAILSIILFVISEKTGFRKTPYWVQQGIIGVLFGIAAISGTVFGVDVGGAMANVRDAAPLCAGLIFGGPAGIIAGFIGGIHRWIAAYYGAGMYSQVACSVSTALAGIYAAVLRRYMFENRRVNWSMGALIAVVMETIHLIILFLTHISDATQAYAIVKIVTIPMLLVNAFAVGISAGIIQLISALNKKNEARKQTLSERIQQWLLLSVFVAYLVTTIFVYALQSSTAVYNAKNLLITNMEDVSKDIKISANTQMLLSTKTLRTQYVKEGYDNSKLDTYAKEYGFQEINIVDENGIVIASTNPDYINYDMGSAEQSAEFLIMNTYKIDSYIQEFGHIGYDSTDSSRDRKYAGAKLPAGGFIQTGYDYDGLHKSLNTVIDGIAENRRIGQTGYMLVANKSGRVVSDYGGNQSYKLVDTGVDITGKNPGETFNAVVYGVDCLCMYGESEGIVVVSVLPEKEIYESRDSSIYVNSYMEIITFAALFTIIFFLIKMMVVDDIKTINAGLGRIIGGKLDERLKVNTTKEMAELTGYINDTVDTLNRYIQEAKERNKKDMELAKDIQHSALPSVFPPFPDIKEFDIYATMDTAKEVGGDFYDFFMLSNNMLAFGVADVSGKGIPAAMFMMRAKTLIKSIASTGKDIDQVITEVNNQLCQNNDAGMFVTAWFGVLDIKTGHVNFVNAGHNPPLVYRKGEGYSYLKSRAGLVLAGMEGIPYRRQELTLQPGDRLFLYTDGVTEATSIHTELYGEDRLLGYLNEHTGDDIHNIPCGVNCDINRFIEGAEQFDDMTMLVLEYKGI